MRVEGWHVVTDPGVEPMATKKDVAWAYVNEAGGCPSLEIKHCNEAQRADIPIVVVEMLLDAWRRGRKP